MRLSALRLECASARDHLRAARRRDGRMVVKRKWEKREHSWIGAGDILALRTRVECVHWGLLSIESVHLRIREWRFAFPAQSITGALTETQA